MSTLQASNLRGPSNTGTAAILSSLNGGPLAGLRNRLLNGAFTVDQRNAGGAQAYTAGAALAYGADRWYGFCTGAGVSGQRINAGGTERDPFRYQFTGAASVTGIGIGQRIEAVNCRDLAAGPAVLSVSLANTVLTTVNWQAFYANTTDTFGTLASPARTSIASGSFTVNSTYSRYITPINIPAAATTGIEIVFSVGAQTSGTWTIGSVQLEGGEVASAFEQRPFNLELLLCQRYYATQNTCARFTAASGGHVMETPVYYPTVMRVSPTIGGPLGATNTNLSAASVSGVSNQSGRYIITATGAGDASGIQGQIQLSAEL